MYVLTVAFRGDGEAWAISLSGWGPLLHTFRTVTSAGHLLLRNPTGNTVPLGSPSLSARALAPGRRQTAQAQDTPIVPLYWGMTPTVPRYYSPGIPTHSPAAVHAPELRPLGLHWMGQDLLEREHLRTSLAAPSP